MGLRWQRPTGTEATLYGFDDRGFLAATVVRYRDPIPVNGRSVGGHPWFAAYLGRDRLPGRWETAEAAKVAADHAAAPSD